MAWARMVSATGLAWAAAIGAAPRMISPIAPTPATEPMLADASGLRASRCSQPLPPARLRPGRGRGGGRGHVASAGARASAR